MMASVRRSMMSIETTRATLLYRTNARIKTAVGYRTVLWQKLNAGIGSASDPSAREREAEINRLLSGYPRNHDYRIVRKRLIPSFRLYARGRLLAQLYPPPLARRSGR